MPTLTRVSVESAQNDDSLPSVEELPEAEVSNDALPPLPVLQGLGRSPAPQLNAQKKKRKYRALERIDLNDVPPQPLILKNSLPREYTDNSRRRPFTEGKSSRYLGVYFDSNLSKWKAQMMIEGTVRSLGYYANEEDAAATYAKAAFKYKKKKANDSTYGGMDLSSVPPQPLIRRDNVASGYKGVHKNKERWEARIKGVALGTFDSREEAAGIYARAVYYINRERENQDIEDIDNEVPAAAGVVHPHLETPVARSIPQHQLSVPLTNLNQASAPTSREPTSKHSPETPVTWSLPRYQLPFGMSMPMASHGMYSFEMSEHNEQGRIDNMQPALGLPLFDDIFEI